MRFICYGGFALLVSCSGNAVSIGANDALGGANQVLGGALTAGGGATGVAGGGAAVSGGGTAAGGVAMGDGAGTAGSKAGYCAVRLASGDGHTCIGFDDGRVRCFGANEHGQLGIGTLSTSEPLGPASLEPAGLLAAGGNRTCAMISDGVYCWGDNSGSGLGVQSSELTLEALPRRVITSEQLQPALVQLALGRHHGCALNALVHGICWGTNGTGDELVPPTGLGQIGAAPLQILQLGGGEIRLLDGDRLYDVSWKSTSAPDGLQTVRGASNGVIENAIGIDHDCLLKRSGMVFCKGAGYPDFYSIVADFGRDVVEVRAGRSFTCVRTSAGQVLCRGGQLSAGSSLAAPVPGIDNAVELSIGAEHACARLYDGSVWCWGAVPGQPLRALPEKISGPGPAQVCAPTAEINRPWGLPAPPARPVDERSDSALAWGQNQCRCAARDANPIDVEGCAAAETTVLNGCLQALAPNVDAEVHCRTESSWNAAVCSLRCLGTGSLPAECVNAGSGCEDPSGVVAFCSRRRLACDSNGAAGVDAPYTCDGIRDCPNGFDEANCTPNAGKFTCADGSVIAPELVKDQIADCPDSSDEWAF